MRLLFVCSGNTCRSPMAEAIARAQAELRSLEVEVGSAGTNAWEGGPASDGAILVALEHDLDLSTHRARVLSRELVSAADLVLTMGPTHLERVQALGGNGKAHLLTAYATHGKDATSVMDPFGGDLDLYRGTYDELARAIGQVLDRVVAERA